VGGSRLAARLLLGKDHGLHAGDFEAFTAAHVLAGHHVIFAQHVGARLGKAGSVAFVGASGELALLSADHPVDLVLAGLMAVGTVQRGWLLVLPFVEKVAFFHGAVVGRSSLVVGLTRYRTPAVIRLLKSDYCRFVADKLWQHGDDGTKEEGEAISGGDRGQGVGARARRCTSGGEGCFGEKEEAREAQADAGEVVGGVGVT